MRNYQTSASLVAGITAGFAFLAAFTHQPEPFAIGFGISAIVALTLAASGVRPRSGA